MEIKLKFINIKNGQAVLKMDNGDHEVLWPQDKLPEGISEGEYLNFLISSSDFDDSLRKQKAKDILNEILNVE
ncbi:MAG: hypothetical protein WCY43_02740 [Patescibacteria group bacterium]|nr:hypothetical protein [Patescibacteria group bacterium]